MGVRKAGENRCMIFGTFFKFLNFFSINKWRGQEFRKQLKVWVQRNEFSKMLEWQWMKRCRLNFDDLSTLHTHSDSLHRPDTNAAVCTVWMLTFRVELSLVPICILMATLHVLYLNRSIFEWDWSLVNASQSLMCQLLTFIDGSDQHWFIEMQCSTQLWLYQLLFIAASNFTSLSQYACINRST